MTEAGETDVVFSVLISSMGGPSLAGSVKSIFADGYRCLEVILVIDDPAVDVSSVLRACLSESDFFRLIIIRNKVNIGLTKSLNVGLAQCKGKYLCRLDDDDFFVNGRLQKVQKFFENNPQIALVTGGAKVQVSSGECYSLSVPCAHPEIEQSLIRRNILVHSALHVRLDIIKKLNGYNEDFYYSQDYEIYLRMLRAGYKFSALDALLVYRVEGEGSITIKKRRHQALYSLAALSLHHAKTWKSEKQILKMILLSFLRFYAPKAARTIIRKLRSFRNNVSL